MSATLPGTSGNNITSPDTAALSVTGDIDIRIKVALASYTPSAEQSLVGKWNDTGPVYSYLFTFTTAGRLILFHSTNGTVGHGSQSTASVSASANQAIWLRGTYATSSGLVQYFTSPDGVTYTQLGSNVTVTSGVIFNGGQGVTIGGHSSGSVINGKVYAVEIRDGIAGTVVASPVFSVATANTTYTDPQGNVWTRNGSASWKPDGSLLLARRRAVA